MSFSPSKRHLINAIAGSSQANVFVRSQLSDYHETFYSTTLKEDKIGKNLTDFEIMNAVGKGASGVVYQVKSLKNEQIYCMKKINIKQFKSQFKADPITEAQILKKVKHPNIIRYHRSFINQEFLYIVMEYAEGGDMQKVIL